MEVNGECVGGSARSMLAERTYNGSSLNAAVAQWIEYWPPKPRVVGSIPASRTIRPSLKTSLPLRQRAQTSCALGSVCCISKARGYSRLRACPVMSAVKRTAVFTGKWANSNPRTRRAWAI